MSTRSCIAALLGAGLVLAVLGLACGSSSPSGPVLSLTAALNPWDGGDEAGCSIAGSGTRVGCDTVYRITGDPSACAGFDGGTGSAARCEVLCNSGLVCSLTGLSDGTNGVDCSANCASPEH